MHRDNFIFKVLKKDFIIKVQKGTGLVELERTSLCIQECVGLSVVILRKGWSCRISENTNLGVIQAPPHTVPLICGEMFQDPQWCLKPCVVLNPIMYDL